MPSRGDREDRPRRSRSRSRSPRKNHSRSPSRRGDARDSRRREERPERRREDAPSRRHEERGYDDRRHRSLPRPPARQRSPRPDAPNPGAICRGHVHTLKPFGVFVSLDGFERHGLVHHTQVADDLNLGRDDEDDDKITALEYFCPRGAQVWVKVLEVQREGRGSVKVACSMKAVDQDSGQDLDPGNSAAMQPRRGGDGSMRQEPPELDSVHKATVASIRPFGAFVRLEGYRANGLVHVSQISDHMDVDRDAGDEAKVAAIGEVLSVGEPVWVKVIEIKDADPGSDRGPKISCSIKLVSQRDGQDLDPNGLKFKPRPADGGFGGKRVVGADAGQAQRGVIDWGHLSADKVNIAPDYGAGYELIGEEVEGIAPRDNGGAQVLPGPPPGGPPPSARADRSPDFSAQGVGSVEEALAILRKHEKRKKKSSKSKKHKDKEKKKKKKKEKRSKRSPSSSSSDDD